MAEMSAQRWLEKPYEEMAERGERFEKLTEHYTAEAEKDCTDAVTAASEERLQSVVITLGNTSRYLRTNGDISDKIKFIDSVCLGLDLIIREYAKEQAERALERGE